MHSRRLTLLAIMATVVAGAGGALASLAVAATQHHYGPRLLVPGKSIGPVHLGELKANVQLGRSTSNGPGSMFYRDYSLTVAYKHARVVAIATNILAVDPNALVSPGQYQTHTHPDVLIGALMGNVASRYPKAQCAHHVISHVPSLVTENCLLRSSHGHTFFAGAAGKQGQPIHIAAILVTVPAAGPQQP